MVMAVMRLTIAAGNNPLAYRIERAAQLACYRMLSLAIRNAAYRHSTRLVCGGVGVPTR